MILISLVRNCRGDLLDFQVKVEQEDRVLTKTKRILKREKAKQRVMIKQEISSISDISSKYIPEGFNDPDLDDKTKKKMIQMIRNRISAQNSRDRKKQYVQQLEALHYKASEDSRIVMERNKKLQEENKRLIAMNAQLMEENIRLKACNVTCSNCGRSTDGSSINSPLSNENPPSPNYNPFSGSPKSKAFASFFCIATIISCLMYNNLASQGITLPSMSRFNWYLFSRFDWCPAIQSSWRVQ
jgi:bZIP transcription factor